MYSMTIISHLPLQDPHVKSKVTAGAQKAPFRGKMYFPNNVLFPDPEGLDDLSFRQVPNVDVVLFGRRKQQPVSADRHLAVSP